MSPLHGSRESYEDHWSVLAPAVSADGVHVWPFDPTFPIDVRYLTSGRLVTVTQFAILGFWHLEQKGKLGLPCLQSSGSSSNPAHGG